MKCDHSLPKCQKCQNRGIGEQVSSTSIIICFVKLNAYVVLLSSCSINKAPWSNTEALDSISYENFPTKVILLEVSNSVESDTVRSREDSAQNLSQASPEAWQASVLTTTHRHIRSPAESVRPFYLGSTSYAAVFSEGRNVSSSIDGQSPETTITTPSLVSSGVRCGQLCEYGIGPAIIAKISSYSIYETSIKRYFETNRASALVAPLILSALPQLKRDIEQLAARGNSLEAFCAEITNNTARQIKVPSSMTASSFHKLFTGPNLRWEILGIMFAVSGMNAQYTSPDDPLFIVDGGRKIDREEFISDVISGSNSCIHLCQEHGAVNDLMVWLLYTDMLLLSNFYGDSCKLISIGSLWVIY